MNCYKFFSPLHVPELLSHTEVRVLHLLLPYNYCPNHYNYLITSFLLNTTNQCPINLPLKKILPLIIPLFIKIGPNLRVKAPSPSMPHTKSSLRYLQFGSSTSIMVILTAVDKHVHLHLPYYSCCLSPNHLLKSYTNKSVLLQSSLNSS